MSVFMPHWPKPLGKRPVDLNLDRVFNVLNKLGNPQNFVPPVIHVAGTNGKGSTIAFLRSILKKSGYDVHVYTSPHLIYFNERILISGNQITDRYIHQILEEVREASRDEKITFFEGTTIAAILAFSKNKADFCLIETGMGGRLDATNVFSNPLLTIITSISYDHVAHLGDSLKNIAYEKSGIIKKGCLCIISEQNNDARAELEKQAINKRVPVFRFGFEWDISKDINKLIFKSGGESELFAIPNLIGNHQIINAGNAIAAVTMLRNKFQYLKIDYESINEGLQNTKWPARLQQITEKNNKLVKILPEGWQLFLDGAHNTGGAIAISNWLKDEKVHFIIGMTRDKDTKTFLNTIKANILSLFSVCVKSEPRSQTTDEIFNTANAIGIRCCESEDIKSAIVEIIKENKLEKSKIIICGSLFLARDINNYNFQP